MRLFGFFYIACLASLYGGDPDQTQLLVVTQGSYMGEIMEKNNLAEEENIQEEVKDVEEELDENGKPIEKEEVEAWMAEDDPDQKGEDIMPVSAHIRKKRKLQAKITERDDENELLRAENEQLKANQASQVPVELPKRPRRDDFDDDNRYEEALDKFEADKTTVLYNKMHSEQTARNVHDGFKQKVNTAVDSHYDRADKLLESSGISESAYKGADETVRKAVESIRPGQGDSVVDYMITVLGEGSEKVMYKLGRSGAIRGEFISLLADDPSGLAAATFLGQQKAILLNTKQMKSSAPDPDTQINGDATSDKKVGALKKKYKEAHKAGNGQVAYNTKKAAKAQGLDVSDW